MTHRTNSNPPAHVPGPPDLYRVEPGASVIIRGEPGPRDVSAWGSAIGAAVLRGVKVSKA